MVIFKRHFFFWVILTTYFCFIDPIQAPFFKQAFGTLLIMINYAFVYYIERFLILPKFYKKRLILIILTVLIFFFFFSVAYFNFIIFLGNEGIRTSFTNLPFYKIFISETAAFCIPFIMALGAYQNEIGINEMKSKSKKEKVLLIKELGFLKNQFNSHITFNFLNYCYNKIHGSCAETAESIEIFSKMLRYSLNNNSNEMIQISKEIEYIQDFIKLQKLLSNNVNIKFLFTIENNSILILPRILISLVENAFKHGNMHSLLNPITIELSATLNSLYFKIVNEKSVLKIIEHSGIGHNNLKQQLNLFYKDKYILEIEDNKTSYSAKLKLKLN